MTKFFKTLMLPTVILTLISTAYAIDIRDPAAQAGFEPHKALYDIELVSTKSGSQIVNITGQMFYEWQPSCDGWISNHRFNLHYEYADTAPADVSSDFSNFEAFDGSTLDFTSQRKREGNLYEELRGAASIEKGEGGEALYSLPKGLKYDLPEGTIYPIMHTVEVLDAAKKGKKFYSATVFDGSDEDGPVEINAFIGKSQKTIPALFENEDIDQSLLQEEGRKIRLAFFPLNNPSSFADYEMSLVFQDNSVISDMKVDYEDFSVVHKLVALEKLDPVCEDKAHE